MHVNVYASYPNHPGELVSLDGKWKLYGSRHAEIVTRNLQITNHKC